MSPTASGVGTPAQAGTDPAPRISVVVLASRHRQYAGEALASVVSQTLPRDRFEILLVRDYEDSALDRAAAEAGARVVPVPATGLGTALAAGLAESRGELLSYLDDDDRYRPERLATVLATFDAEPALGYYRNGYALIDGRGAPLSPHPFRAAQRSAQARLGPVEFGGAAQIDRLRAWPNLGFDFCESTITVRRSLLGALAGHLDLTKIRNADAFCYFAALAGAGRLRAEPVELTEYRLHAGNVSAGGATDPLAQRRAFSRWSLESYAVLAQGVAAIGPPAAVEEAEGTLAVQRGYAVLREPTSGRAEVHAARRGVRSLRRTYAVRSEPRLSVALGLSALSPRLGRWLYGRAVARGGR